jgi:hypothetical protein
MGGRGVIEESANESAGAYSTTCQIEPITNHSEGSFVEANNLNILVQQDIANNKFKEKQDSADQKVNFLNSLRSKNFFPNSPPRHKTQTRQTKLAKGANLNLPKLVNSTFEGEGVQPMKTDDSHPQNMS